MVLCETAYSSDSIMPGCKFLRMMAALSRSLPSKVEIRRACNFPSYRIFTAVDCNKIHNMDLPEVSQVS